MVYYKIEMKVLEHLLECEKRLQFLQSFGYDTLDINGNFSKVCEKEAKQDINKFNKIGKDSE